MNEGYAVAIKWDAEGNATMWHLTHTGYDYLGAIMRRNAEKLIAAGEGSWSPPQSRQIVGLVDAS
jgi:hypothetical protein